MVVIAHAAVTLAYHHHSSGGGGFVGYFARLVFRAAVYRVIFGLPMPVVLVLGAVAGFFVWRSFRRVSNRSARIRR